VKISYLIITEKEMFKSSKRLLIALRVRGIIHPTGNQAKSRSQKGGFMGLFRRDHVWWVRFTYRGKQIRASTQTEDKELAQRTHYKVLGEVAGEKWLERLPG
jgi:hypothetical protein